MSRVPDAPVADSTGTMTTAGEPAHTETPSQTQTPPPCPPETGTQEGPVSSVVPPPPPTPPLPAGDHGASGTGSQAAPVTGSSAASAVAHADPVKYTRAPVTLHRPQGPSLLTQALATARGIPRQAQSDHASQQSYKFQPSNPSSLSHQISLSDQRDATPWTADSRTAGAVPQDRDNLTQGSRTTSTSRPSSRHADMPTLTATSTTTVLSPAYARLDIGDVSCMLSGHDSLSKNKPRTASHGAAEQDRPSRGVAAGSPEKPAKPHDVTNDARPSEVVRPQPRAWIGAGDPENSEDGQVEKSISEVLAGVERDNRSRKASHSLRFFKAGLPEEKGRRKDHRTAREKSPGRGEKLANIQEQSSEPRAPGDETAADRTDRPKKSASKADVDSKQGGHTESGESQPAVVEEDGQQEPGSGPPTPRPKPRRVSDLSVGAGESGEEGEDSGEEKISSAVFLPHKEPDVAQERSAASRGPQRMAPSRRHSRHDADDFHPWLVKADEPEVDDEPRDESLDLDTPTTPKPPAYPSVAPELASRQVDDESASALTDHREPSAFSSSSSYLSHPAAEYHDDAAQDQYYQRPLEAIELIPYKHQVGGHTTLWRFSRRAVCKQLNKRENEFYEKVERYHRDLLAFLPRYIGVLNVTFQKQPRRKSTLKRDEAASGERSQVTADGTAAQPTSNGGTANPDDSVPPTPDRRSSEPSRIISQSAKMKAQMNQVPMVTFVDNAHILPRSLLQPAANLPNFRGRIRSASATCEAGGGNGDSSTGSKDDSLRPEGQERPNSWGATMVNKRLRNEVFNDAFLKQPIAIHRNRRAHHRLARRALQQTAIRPPGPEVNGGSSGEKRSQSMGPPCLPPGSRLNGGAHGYSRSETFPAYDPADTDDEAVPHDVTGTSAPEPEILGGDSSPAARMKKRRFSGTGLRRKPRDVRDGRGELKYYAEADDAGAPVDVCPSSPARDKAASESNPTVEAPLDPSRQPSPPVAHPPTSPVQSGPLEPIAKIPRPVNPKEAQTQRDSRVEYFLLLEDLTAGMKRPCIMDLKMGTRQYGVDATPKKQKSQQGKCAKTTSRELGVRLCGLQVWDVKTQSYIFKDKYYGRELKKGAEFQAALTRFLYDGVDRASILRHIPTVLQKLDELEVIIKRLRGYRFYAASLLMFYDGEPAASETNQPSTSNSGSNSHNTNTNGNNNNYYIEDSTTDFATDAEEPPSSSTTQPPTARIQDRRRRRRNPREIDFKMADFANCVTAGDLSARDRPCPPRYPDEPDRGFLRGLRSLRKYFLRIQRDTRAELGLVSGGATGAAGGRGGAENGGGLYADVGLETEAEDEDEGNVSE
ncbi:hypothetical protein VTJ04DRAFT_8515 [Mycothermus thermophilus]|uniref:uncharacterized protein n=1 Tax=Humicola insolens TaxID=85995 RepID=UPI0037423AE3